MEKLSEWEMINQKLKLELKDAAQLLIAKSNELVNSKAELQRHRQEIDVSVQLMSLWNLLHRTFFSLSLSCQRLNQDICNLSTLCASATAAAAAEEKNEKKIDKEEILAALRAWQESGNLPEDVEIVSQVVNACNEVIFLPFHGILEIFKFFRCRFPY